MTDNTTKGYGPKRFMAAIETGELAQLIKDGADRHALREFYGISDSMIYTHLPVRLKTPLHQNHLDPKPRQALFFALLTPARKLALCERWA